jgi:hypothetical protein
MHLEVERPSALSPSLLDAIAHVVRLRAELEVGRVAARWVVAGVHHDHPTRDWPIHPLPGHTVSGAHDSLHRHQPISLWIAEAGPQVAARRLVDLHVCAQSLGDRPVRLLHDRRLKGSSLPEAPVVSEAESLLARMATAAMHAADLLHDVVFRRGPAAGRAPRPSAGAIAFAIVHRHPGRSAAESRDPGIAGESGRWVLGLAARGSPGMTMFE